MSAYRTDDGERIQAASLIRHDEAVTVTIAASGTTSTAVDARASAMYGVALPAAFTGTALTFMVSDTEAGTYQTLEASDGSPVALVVEQGKSYTIPNEIAPWPWFKLVSGSPEAAGRSIVVTRKR